MRIRYVLRDGMQAGIIYVTRRGVHIVGDGDLVNFFRMMGGLKDDDFIIHPLDDEGDQFIELSSPLDSEADVENAVEKELNNHGYVLSPRRF